MRKLFVLIAVVGLVAASCGGDSGGGSCESVADDAIAAFQTVITELDSMTLDELGQLGEEDPPVIVEMEATLEDLQGQAEDLGCSDAEMEELLTARVGTLEADGAFGELMIAELEAGGLFE